MQLIGLKDSLDQLRAKGFITDQQMTQILEAQPSGNAYQKKEEQKPDDRLWLSSLPKETAQLCQDILYLNCRLEEETVKTREIRNRYYHRSIQKFKLAVFFHSLCTYLDRRIHSLKALPSAVSSHDPSHKQHTAAFYEHALATLRCLCQSAFPRFQFN